MFCKMLKNETFESWELKASNIPLDLTMSVMYGSKLKIHTQSFKLGLMLKKKQNKTEQNKKKKTSSKGVNLCLAVSVC